ncbi:SHOCT domain-containing protein, partial [[Eubacterium] cellulosolvens]
LNRDLPDNPDLDGTNRDAPSRDRLNRDLPDNPDLDGTNRDLATERDLRDRDSIDWNSWSRSDRIFDGYGDNYYNYYYNYYNYYYYYGYGYGYYNWYYPSSYYGYYTYYYPAPYYRYYTYYYPTSYYGYYGYWAPYGYSTYYYPTTYYGYWYGGYYTYYYPAAYYRYYTYYYPATYYRYYTYYYPTSYYGYYGYWAPYGYSTYYYPTTYYGYWAPYGYGQYGNTSYYSGLAGASLVEISIEGLPSDYYSYIWIDGEEQGSIQGGSSKEFQVSNTESHLFEIESYVAGPEGVIYYCGESSWTLESTEGTDYQYSNSASTYDTQDSSYYPIASYTNPPSSYGPRPKVSHTFDYGAEYFLAVENPHEYSTDQTGWKPKDTVVTLSTPERVESSNQERGNFKAWIVNGVERTENTITLTMNAPYIAIALYENQYYVEVISDATPAQGSGWHEEGSTVTISVPPEVPMTGFWGLLGAKHRFTSWTGPVSAPNSPTTTITADSSQTVYAVWSEDYSGAYIILAIIFAATLILIVAAIIASRRGITLKRVSDSSALDSLNLRYSQGEISREDYLKMKKDLEKS